MLTESVNSENFTVVGPGAIGQMLAFFLQRLGSVQVMGRQGPVALDSLLRDKGKTHRLQLAKAQPNASIFFFACKAYDLAAALTQILPKVPQGSSVVLLSNGYIETVIQHFRGRRRDIIWRKAIVTRGSRVDKDGSLLLSAAGDVIWGGMPAQQAWEKKIFTELSEEGFRWDPDACQRRQEKWYFNTVLNTLCGVYALKRNGDAPEQPEFEALSQEVFALGQRLFSGTLASESELRGKLLELIAKTFDNENSMARDRRLERKTEAEFLSGHVRSVAHGERDFPLLWHLDQQLLQREGKP